MAIAVVGSINQDTVVTVERLPGPGETVVGTSTIVLAGGKGANQAAAAAALGARVHLVGAVGTDDAGAAMLADLRARGVDTTHVRRADAPTGTATVVVDPAGENLIVVAPGANSALSPADVQIDAVRDAAVLLVQLEIPFATVQAAIETARGVVVLNPAPARPLPAELLRRVDVLVPNEAELRALGDVTAARARVVTFGARGVRVENGGRIERIDAPDVQVADTTGAGDCFCAALCVALERGDGLAAAARYANAAAALSTTAAGARGKLPTHAEVVALLGPG